MLYNYIKTTQPIIVKVIMSNADHTPIKHIVNSTSILDNIFKKYGWVKMSPNQREPNKVEYRTTNDVFSKFVIEHLGNTRYKIAMPLTDTRYCYVTQVYSVFELLDYVENVLQSREKKIQ